MAFQFDCVQSRILVIWSITSDPLAFNWEFLAREPGPLKASRPCCREDNSRGSMLRGRFHLRGLLFRGAVLLSLFYAYRLIGIGLLVLDLVHQCYINSTKMTANLYNCDKTQGYMSSRTLPFFIGIRFIG